MIITLRHEAPKEFSLSASFGAMTDAVLGNTYDHRSSVFSHIKRSTKPKFIVPLQGKVDVPSAAKLPNSHKFDVERVRNGMAAEGVGSAKQAKQQFWPKLSDIEMYSLDVEEDGMREPH